MKCKATLKQNATYKNIYIEHHLTPEERNSIANLMTIAKVIGYDKLYATDYCRKHTMRSRVTLTSGKKCGTAERRPLTRYARDLAGQITDAEMKPSQDVMIPTVLHIAMSISRHVTDTRRAIANHARDTSRRHQGYHDGEDRRNYTHDRITILDHSVLQMTLSMTNFKNVDSINTSVVNGKLNKSKIIHDRQNIPEEKINLIEADRDRQEHIDNSYTEFLDILNSQMKTHLNPREKISMQTTRIISELTNLGGTRI
ncbi:LOW QUALITY PROTEIN: hypothetical protein MAR_019901 [Mya arenaria]|uniref:Uncharacterized protein n=1 Tax=Mya arenaria TaxID=6604 RepID=A0ABY7E6E9_MYAAR|nr:LOW QUALITY PROTEIN: hypothetical protein MAR_019901 [Mya arenaria]